jgi:hypothetical protein
MFYEFFIRCIVDNKDVNWGMFKGQSISRITASVVVWIAFLVFIALPFINDLCIGKIRRSSSQRLIWQ